MNLLVIEPAEVGADARCAIRDRRAQHLREVVGARVGSRVRAGIVGGGKGTAEVVADDGVAITLQLALTDPPSMPLPIDLVLAIPRPKVLTRAIEIAVSFGVARIELTNAWRVDKSYLESPRLAPEALADASRRGAEQGATTYIPPIAIHPRLMKLLDARWPAGPSSDPRGGDASRAWDDARIPDALDSWSTTGSPRDARRPDAIPRPETRLIAHPNAPPIETAPLRGDIVLAIGPEGGWIERELDTFVARGFTAVSLGTPILRVEAALAAALAQLMLLRRLGTPA